MVTNGYSNINILNHGKYYGHFVTQFKSFSKSYFLAILKLSVWELHGSTVKQKLIALSLSTGSNLLLWNATCDSRETHVTFALERGSSASIQVIVIVCPRKLCYLEGKSSVLIFLFIYYTLPPNMNIFHIYPLGNAYFCFYETQSKKTCLK